MGKLAFIFSGQGAQYPGMGKTAVDSFKEAADIFDQATEAVGIDMRKLVFEGSEEDLKITENTQPSILTVSTALLMPLFNAGIKPDVTAGLSLGEYTAHVAAGTMNFRDAVRLVRKRGKFMQEAVPVGVGTMAAILGLDNQTVIDCCKEGSAEGIVEPANFNCPGQIVIAGEVKAVEKVVELCKEKGAKRAMLLPVSAPFHCSMLKVAGERLKEELDRIELFKMNMPVVSNVTAEYTLDSTQVRDLLIRQVSNAVKWEDCVNVMLKDGVDKFVEIGPGKVLTGFVRKISKDAAVLNIEDADSLQKAITELGG